MTALALTAAGRAAVADADHVGTEAVTLTHLAFGDGLRPAGADDDARAALRSERDRIAVAGREAADGHVAVVADWTPTRAYALSEIGLVATVDGATVLLAYGAVESAADAVARTAVGTRIVVALDVAVVSSAADLSVTLSPNVQFTAVADATTAVAGISRRATGAEAQAAAEASAEADRAALERAAHLTPYEAARLPIDLRDGAPADRDTLAKLATALAAAETRIAALEENNVDIGLFQAPTHGAAHGRGANANAAASLLPRGNTIDGVALTGRLGLRLPSGDYRFTLRSNTSGAGLNPGIFSAAGDPLTLYRTAPAAKVQMTYWYLDSELVQEVVVKPRAASTTYTVGVDGGDGSHERAPATALEAFVLIVERIG